MAGVDATDKQWDIENDARTLREAEEIKADSKRFKKAAKELKKQAEAAKRASAVVNATKGLGRTFTSE